MKRKPPTKTAQAAQKAQSRTAGPDGADKAHEAGSGDPGPSGGQLEGRQALDVDQEECDAPVAGPDDMEPPENNPAPIATGDDDGD